MFCESNVLSFSENPSQCQTLPNSDVIVSALFGPLYHLFQFIIPTINKTASHHRSNYKTSLTCVLWYRRMAENRDVLKCVLTETNADEQRSRREPVFSRCTVSCSSGEADLNRCATLSCDPILLTVLQPFVPHLFPSGEKLLLSLRPERHMEGLGSCNG